MLPDCPACSHEMNVRLEGLSIPAIECPECRAKFDRLRDWVNLTPLVRIRREGRKLRLRTEMVKCRLSLWYLRLSMLVTTIRLRFWEYLGALGEQPTPEQSERLTGIEVNENND